jgi:hypothetical protein
MTYLKKLIRLFSLALLIALAMTGVGLFGALFSSREKYENRPMNIEQRDRKTKDEEAPDREE